MVYEVLYEPLETFNGNITDQKINTTTQFITLMGLEEFTNYSISVRGYTIVGPGNYSVPVLVMTFEDGKFNIVHNIMSCKHCYICLQFRPLVLSMCSLRCCSPPLLISLGRKSL